MDEMTQFLDRNKNNINAIAKFLEGNKDDVCWKHEGSSHETKLIVNGDNLLHLAARTKNTEIFLSIFKKSIESDVRLLEYNIYNENPFHAAAAMNILPSVVKGIFGYLESQEAKSQYGSKKLEEVKSYVINALNSRHALSIRTKMTPLDMGSKEVKKEVKEIADIKDSLICNQKFRLCLYIVGAIACIAALCLSLYFLYLCSQELALASVATIASGGAACLSFKAFGEIYDLHDVSTLMEGISTEGAAKIVAPGT